MTTSSSSFQSEWGRDAAALVEMIAWVTRVGERLRDTPAHQRRPGDTTAGAQFMRWAHDLLVEAIERSFPGDEVISGAGGRPGTTDWTWVANPLDGAEWYSAGLPLWAVGVARLKNGVPIVSVVVQPAARLVFAGSWNAARVTRNGRPHTLPESEKGVVMSSLTDVPTLVDGCALAEGGHDGLMYDGRAAWAIAPLVPILGPLGILITDADGNEPTRYDGRLTGVVLARPAFHPLLLEHRRSRPDRPAGV